ncbi:DUF4190 domain-containing protein [Isosphaeraceae bacterium EP7]
MATSDAPTTASASASNTPAIENQIIAYRALSPLAVTSLLLGLVSVLSFAGDFFYLISAAAVVTGFLANRKINRYPDMLTGASLAKAGIAMGLTFGLASFTMSMVQSTLQRRSAEAFAKTYASAIKKGELADALWYQVPAQSRKLETPKQIIEKMRATQNDESNFKMQNADLLSLMEQLAQPGSDVQFEGIESHVVHDMEVIASAVIDVHVDAAKDQIAKDQHALVVLKGTAEGGGYTWAVDGVKYPYVPRSFVPAPAKKHDDSDGHGHSH